MPFQEIELKFNKKEMGMNQGKIKAHVWAPLLDQLC